MGLLVSFGFILVSFFVGVYLFRWLLARFGKRWRVPAADHWGALIVLALIFQTLNFFEEPLYNAISRGFEHNADVYGQEVIHGIVADPAKTAQSSFDALGTLTFDNPEPSPLDFWTDNHPTTSFRAAFAKHYDPWTAGNAPKYFKR
jgi:Zn-dependent protease with chaperone function